MQPSQFFSDSYYNRIVNQQEISSNRANEPSRFEAIEVMARNVRFCDVFQYLDSISVNPALVENADYFFQMMANCTNG